ncbi:MAG: hypothetical protein HC888_02285 [Candidatus Competibacteraceae bacterium]|nr:hypothetical protein [Candidatus Competibacteraceae bacterium]
MDEELLDCGWVSDVPQGREEDGFEGSPDDECIVIWSGPSAAAALPRPPATTTIKDSLISKWERELTSKGFNHNMGKAIVILGLLYPGGVTDFELDDSALLQLRELHSENLSRTPRYWYDTECIGRILLDYGFPIVNVSSRATSTLVIRIDLQRVIKVARYAQLSNAREYERHRQQRNLDVVLSHKYPNSFARTEYRWIKPITYGLDFYHEVYIQEYLVPLARERPHDFSSWSNWRDITNMLVENPSIQFNQWGTTTDGRLVCYDYE